MSVTSVERGSREVAAYGGLVDAAGGAATVVLAIIGLSGMKPDILLAVATIVFGAALLIQSGTILCKLTHMTFPANAAEPVEELSPGGLSVVFLVGTAGIVLGILALIGTYSTMLTSIAVIAFGAALVFGSNAVWGVHKMKHAAMRTAGQRAVTAAEILVTEVAAGSAGIQAIAGLTAIVLGILAVTDHFAAALSLVGLLVMGATLLLTCSSLMGVVQSFMQRSMGARQAGWTGSPAE